MRRLALIAVLMLAACNPSPGEGDAGGNAAVESATEADGADGANNGQVIAGTADPNAATGLKTGEYACYGSGGAPLVGLGFKVTAPGRYTDLDDGNAGRFSVDGSNVTFSGGHLDGQTGRDLKDGKFTIGAMAGCEPW